MPKIFYGITNVYYAVVTETMGTGGEYSEEELDAIRGLHRTAQWFFDYDYVENSEGAHNSTLAKRCLDTAEETIQEAMGLFKS